MTIDEIKNGVKAIVPNNLGNAIETLRSLAKSNDLFNAILLIQSGHNGLAKRIMAGDLSEKDITLKTNQLRSRFLSIIDSIDDDSIIMEKAGEVLQKKETSASSDKSTTPNPSDKSTQIYFSYAWGGDSETIVDQLDKELQERGLNVIRDKKDLGYKGSITGFMDAIGKGNKIIVVISKKYLESEYCMYELTEIYENKDFAKRIFPIILDDSNIFSPVGRIGYINYWDAKIKELDTALKSVGTGVNLSQLQQELNNYGEIRASFDKMAFILKDMNALTPEIHRNQNFETLYEELVG